MYEVLLENRVKREIKKLPSKIINRIIEELDLLKRTPRPQGIKKLTAREEYRLVVGDYRILYTIDDKNQNVFIERIKHRSSVYKKR